MYIRIDKKSDKKDGIKYDKITHCYDAVEITTVFSLLHTHLVCNSDFTERKKTRGLPLVFHKLCQSLLSMLLILVSRSARSSRNRCIRRCISRSIESAFFDLAERKPILFSYVSISLRRCS